jgi:hypothetical protein
VRSSTGEAGSGTANNVNRASAMRPPFQLAAEPLGEINASNFVLVSAPFSLTTQ